MITGIVLRKGKKLDLLSYKDSMVDVLNQFNTADRTGFYYNDNVILVQTTRFNTPESFFDPTPYIDNVTGNAIVSWGILTNRDELASELGILPVKLKEICDSELILKSYHRWGETCVNHLYGDYSVVVYDNKKDSIFCFVDHMGVKPFYYYISEDYFLFASTIAVFHKLKITPMKPDMEWMAKYLLHISMDFVKTAYTDIFKLKPANCLSINRDSHKIKEYFRFDPEENHSLGSLENYLEIYKDILNKAVASRIRTKYNLGSESSGGLDSSTTTALAARLFEQPIENFYTFGFAFLEYEPQYILQVSQKYGIMNNFICCAGQNNLDKINTRAIKVMGALVEHGIATFHTVFYEKAQASGIRTLLSGFGGDEFVTTIHGYLFLEQLLQKRKYLEFYRNLPGNCLTRPLRFMKKYYKYKFLKREGYNQRFLHTWNQRWPHCIIRDDIVEAYDLKKKYFDTARFDAGYSNINAFTLENRFAPFVPTRMGNCSLIAESYGIDYYWPLLDVRMVQFFLSVPSSMKYHKGTGRYFHRKALEGILPSGVNWKPNKYMGEKIREDEENITLDTSELHESLTQIVDLKKLDKIISIGYSSNKRELISIFRRNKLSVHALDQWLKTLS